MMELIQTKQGDNESITDFIAQLRDSPSSVRSTHVPQKLQTRFLYNAHASDLRRAQRHTHDVA